MIRKRSNLIVAGLYGIGLLAILGTMLIVRFRLDRMVELTI